MIDTLGDRMKRYESVTRNTLPPHSITILRVDGRAFHSYLRQATKPYDLQFIRDMQVVGRSLCREISGAVFAYGQSDEISVLISDVEPQSQPWFGGVVQKMASVAASIATAALMTRRGCNPTPTFDARVFTVSSWMEAGNYFLWRQRDAVRNSVSMAAQAVFTHKELMNQSTGSMQEMLWRHGINWNDYPEEAKRGWVVSKATYKAMVTFTNKRTMETSSTVADRTLWVTSTPQLTIDSPVLYMIPSVLEGGDASDDVALAP